jgi:hypothetical protein
MLKINLWGYYHTIYLEGQKNSEYIVPRMKLEPSTLQVYEESVDNLATFQTTNLAVTVDSACVNVNF